MRKDFSLFSRNFTKPNVSIHDYACSANGTTVTTIVHTLSDEKTTINIVTVHNPEDKSKDFLSKMTI